MKAENAHLKKEMSALSRDLDGKAKEVQKQLQQVALTVMCTSVTLSEMCTSVTFLAGEGLGTSRILPRRASVEDPPLILYLGSNLSASFVKKEVLTLSELRFNVSPHHFIQLLFCRSFG